MSFATGTTMVFESIIVEQLVETPSNDISYYAVVF